MVFEQSSTDSVESSVVDSTILDIIAILIVVKEILRLIRYDAFQLLTVFIKYQTNQECPSIWDDKITITYTKVKLSKCRTLQYNIIVTYFEHTNVD